MAMPLLLKADMLDFLVKTFIGYQLIDTLMGNWSMMMTLKMKKKAKMKMRMVMKM